MPKGNPAKLRRECCTDIEQAIGVIGLAMRKYGARFVNEQQPHGSGLAQLEEALGDFYVARSEDEGTGEHEAAVRGKTVCRDHGQLLARLAVPGAIFTQNERQIAACVGYGLLGKAGFEPDLDRQEWVDEVEKASSKAEEGRWSSNSIENAAVEYARAIQNTWRWSGVPKPHFLEGWLP
jgi:hypothetical protein